MLVEHNDRIPVAAAKPATLRPGHGKYIYNFETGAAFTIPGRFHLRRAGDGTCAISSTSAFRINGAELKAPGRHNN